MSVQIFERELQIFVWNRKDTTNLESLVKGNFILFVDTVLDNDSLKYMVFLQIIV